MKIAFVFPADPTASNGVRVDVTEMEKGLPEKIRGLNLGEFAGTFCLNTADGVLSMVMLGRMLNIDKWRVSNALNGSWFEAKHDYAKDAILCLNEILASMQPTCHCGNGNCCKKNDDKKVALAMASPEIIVTIYGMIHGITDRKRLRESMAVWAKDHLLVVDYDGKHLSQG
ncbi:MAG: hypothetical protein WCL61_02570 [bacterium]